MSYLRVCPRDLFNEGNLLKCLGRLWILLDETRGHRAVLSEGDGSPFNVVQDEASGQLSVANLPFTIGGAPWSLVRPLNSRQPWPLYAETDDDSVAVFDDEGRFTPEFVRLIQAPAPLTMDTVFAYLNDKEARPYERLRRVAEEPIPAVEVTEEVYDYFLNILPPGRAPGVDFFVIERITGNVVSSYTKVGRRFFHRYITVGDDQ